MITRKKNVDKNLMIRECMTSKYKKQEYPEEYPMKMLDNHAIIGTIPSKKPVTKYVPQNNIISTNRNMLKHVNQSNYSNHNTSSLMKNLSKFRIKMNSKTSSQLPKNNEPNLETSNSFSIKCENVANDMYHLSSQPNMSSYFDNNKCEDDSNECLSEKDKENLKIVYHLNEDYLVPMILIPSKINDDPEFINMRYAFKSKEVIVNKNDVFYQSLSNDALTGIGNLCSLQVINELSLLKNIQVRLQMKLNFCFIHDVMILIKPMNMKELACGCEDDTSTGCKFFFNEWLDMKLELNELYSSNLILIKNKIYREASSSSPCAVNHNRFTEKRILKDILRIKNNQLNMKFGCIFDHMLDLLEKINMSFIFLMHVNYKSSCHVNFNLIPIFPSNTLSNFLDTESLCFNTRSNHFPVIANNNLEEHLKKLIHSLEYENDASFLKELASEFTSNHLDLLECLYLLLEETKLKQYFKEIFCMVLLSYILYTFKKIVTMENSISDALRKMFTRFDVNMFNEKWFVYYSNLVLIETFAFTVDLISGKLKFQENDYSVTKKTFKSIQRSKGSYINLAFCLFSDRVNEEDQQLLNEVILNRISNPTLVNKNFLSNFMNYYFTENLSQVNKNTGENDLRAVIYLENLFHFKLAQEFYTLGYNNNQVSNVTSSSPPGRKIIDMLFSSFQSSVSNLEAIENQNLIIKQIWSFELESLDGFFQKEENVIDILQVNKFLEYCKMYQQPNTFFAEFSTCNFFHRYLPILKDVDIKYNPLKNYVEPLTNLFTDLQKFQNFTEKFHVTPTSVKIGFISFEVFVLLMKNLKEENAVIIQKHFRGRTITKFFSYFKKNVSKIQKMWRSYHTKKLSKFNSTELLLYYARKYKSKDPFLIKILFNFTKKSLNDDKKIAKLTNKLEEYSIENQCLQKRITENKTNRVHCDSSSITSSALSMKISVSKLQKSIFSCSSGKEAYKKSNYLSNVPKVLRTSNFHVKILEEEIEKNKNLEEKLQAYKTKYNELVKVISEYEKKMERFVSVIKSVRDIFYLQLKKQEIKDVFSKNGIKII